jgi:NADH-quinone oxidoreductase subunit N
MTNDLFYGLLPEHLLLLSILLLMVIEIFGLGGRLAGCLSILAMVGGCVVLSQQLGQGYTAAPVPGEVVIDQFALRARLVILGCGAVYGISSLAVFDSVKPWMLICSSLLGALLMSASASFVTLFLGIELLSLPAFALMVFRSTQPAVEGAFKYLLLSAVASAMILFGISLAYGNTGSLAITEFAASAAGGGPLSMVAFILLVSGFFLKAAVFPFHGWAPDAYSGAKLPVTALLASIVKGAVVLGLVRILGSAVLPGSVIAAIIVLAILSIFFGNITAIRQSTFRRLLAYSSVSHAGYMIFAFADNSGERSEALLFYVVIYALTTIIACRCVALLNPEGDDELETLNGAFARRPLPALLLAFAVLSMAGIPPLPGFFAKLFIFNSVISVGQLWPAVLAFVGSFVGVTYYLGLVVRLFNSGSLPEEMDSSKQSDWSVGAALLGAMMLIVLLF